jgi:hypothetical protein
MMILYFESSTAYERARFNSTPCMPGRSQFSRWLATRGVHLHPDAVGRARAPGVQPAENKLLSRETRRHTSLHSRLWHLQQVVTAPLRSRLAETSSRDAERRRLVCPGSRRAPGVIDVLTKLRSAQSSIPFGFYPRARLRRAKYSLTRISPTTGFRTVHR